jgi:hypothetical protein
LRCQPYLRQRASQNAPLCKASPSEDSGRTFSQCEAPFSWFRSIARWSWGERPSFTDFARFACCCLFLLLLCYCYCCEVVLYCYYAIVMAIQC